MQDVNNGTFLYVLKDIARQVQSVTDDSIAEYLADGEATLADGAGNIVTTADTTYKGKDILHVYYNKGGKIIKSPGLSAKNTSSYKVVPYEAHAEKVMFIGYNGVDGDLEGGAFIAGTTYLVSVRRKEMKSHHFDDYRNVKTSNYYNASSSALQCAVAEGLVSNLVANHTDNNFNVTNFVKATMVSSAASVALAATAKFTEGNKLVIGTGATGVAVGDYIRCSAAKTDDVYKVASISGNNFELTSPYQGVSQVITAQKLTTPEAEDFGIKLVGRDPKFVAGFFNDDLVNFDVTLDNFDNTLVRVGTEATLGSGGANEVKEIEWELEQYEGFITRMDNFSGSRELYADATKNYDYLSLSTADTSHVSIHSRPESLYTIMFAIPTGSTQGDAVGSTTVSPGVAVIIDGWLNENTGSNYSEASNLTA